MDGNILEGSTPSLGTIFTMIPVTELRSGTTFKDKGEIFEVSSYSHTKIGRGSANIKIRARNLRTGESVQKNFTSGVKVEEADIEKRKLQFLYQDADNLVFMDSKSYDQLPIKKSVVGERAKFLKEGESYEVLVSADVVLNVELPKLIELKIAETGPGVKGDTVSNVYKPAILENGISVNVPLFVKSGDVIKIDTRSNEYIERVK